MRTLIFTIQQRFLSNSSSVLSQISSKINITSCYIHHVKERQYKFILYWEYKLVRSIFFCVQKCIISKQNEWTDQLKYCSSLPTTFSHLSDNFRISKKWLVFGDDPILKLIFDFYERSEPVTCCSLRNNQ